MSFRKLGLGLAAATMLAGIALPAFAQDSVYVPSSPTAPVPSPDPEPPSPTACMTIFAC